MNNLDTSKQSVYLIETDQTLDWLQSNWTSGINAILLNSIHNPTEGGAILQGCEITDNAPNLEIAAGWIYLRGELLQVDAHIVSDAGPEYCWVAEESFHQDLDPLPMKDANPENVHVLRRGKLEILAAQPEKVDDTDMEDLRTTAWVEIDSEFNTGFEQATSGRKLKYRKHQGFLELEGVCEYDHQPNGGSEEAFFSIPEGFRPDENVTTSGAWVMDNNVQSAHLLRVLATGSVTINDVPPLNSGDPNGQIHVSVRIALRNPLAV